MIVVHEEVFFSYAALKNLCKIIMIVVNEEDFLLCRIGKKLSQDNYDSGKRRR